HGISTGIAVSVIVIIIVIAAIGGAYCYYYAPGTTTKVQVQTFKFGFLHTEDPSHALAVDALNHMSQFNMKAQVVGISDPTSLTSATSQGQVDMFAFQFPTTTINAIE